MKYRRFIRKHIVVILVVFLERFLVNENDYLKIRRYFE